MGVCPGQRGWSGLFQYRHSCPYWPIAPNPYGVPLPAKMYIPLLKSGDDALMRSVTDGGSGEPFAPIAEYGFLSDAETTALLSPNGSVEWMCLPRIDSPSVF